MTAPGTIREEETCWVCRGDGVIPMGAIVTCAWLCPTCHGRGRVLVLRPVREGES